MWKVVLPAGGMATSPVFVVSPTGPAIPSNSNLIRFVNTLVSSPSTGCEDSKGGSSLRSPLATAGGSWQTLGLDTKSRIQSEDTLSIVCISMSVGSG